MSKEGPEKERFLGYATMARYLLAARPQRLAAFATNATPALVKFSRAKVVVFGSISFVMSFPPVFLSGSAIQMDEMAFDVPISTTDLASIASAISLSKRPSDMGTFNLRPCVC